MKFTEFFKRKRKEKKVYSQVRRYEAALFNRLTADWLISTFKPQDEIRSDLKTLRERSRDLEHNSDLARKYLSLCEANVIGKGIRVLLPDSLSTVREKFYEWANSADVSGVSSFSEFQRKVLRSVVRDGECFVQYVRGVGPDGLGLYLVESDVIDHTYCDVQRNIYNGVKVDQYGKHLSYFNTSTLEKRTEYNAVDLLQVARFTRAQQYRGVPWLAGSMITIKQLSSYLEAEVIAARVAACKMFFYRTVPGSEYNGTGTDSAGNTVTEVSPGAFERLEPGWDVTAIDPTHPTQQFGEFVKSVQRQIAGGLGVSYASLSSDLSDANYSSARIGLLEERVQWEVLQDWFISAFYEPIFNEWLRLASVTGKISVQEKQTAEKEVKFIGRRWGWVDPEKDLNSLEKEINLGLRATSQISAERGEDYASIQKAIADDKSIRAGLGL